MKTDNIKKSFRNYITIVRDSHRALTQSTGAVGFTDCFSPPTNVKYMTLNNLMVRLQ